MAQRQVTVFVDDLTGKELPASEAETLLFALDGVNYEIDTDRKAADKLRNALAPYVGAGRRTGARRGGTRRPAGRKEVAPDPQAIRAWAASNGVQVSARGRIPARVVAQFRAAGN